MYWDVEKHLEKSRGKRVAPLDPCLLILFTKLGSYLVTINRFHLTTYLNKLMKIRSQVEISSNQYVSENFNAQFEPAG